MREELDGLLAFIEQSLADKTFYGEITLTVRAGEVKALKKTRTLLPEDLIDLAIKQRERIPEVKR